MALLFNIIVVSSLFILVMANSAANLGQCLLGIRYVRENGTDAGFGTLLASTLLQIVFYLISFGICIIVDVCMVLGSNKHQGITGGMFEIYPVDRRSSAGCGGL